MNVFWVSSTAQPILSAKIHQVLTSVSVSVEQKETDPAVSVSIMGVTFKRTKLLRHSAANFFPHLIPNYLEYIIHEKSSNESLICFALGREFG